MATEGPNAPGSAASIMVSGAASAWTDPTEALVLDGQYAYNTSVIDNGFSYFLHLTNFGFSIPSNATITGVTFVLYRRFRDNVGSEIVNDRTIQLVVGGTRSGDNKADLATLWPSSITGRTYGSGSDAWSLSLTPAMVNDSDFGVAIQTGNDGTSKGGGGDVDYGSLMITYEIGLHTFQARIWG